MTENIDSTSTTSIQPLFDFNATHNGVNCIASLNPADKGTERQFWFTVQMFIDTFDEQRRTIERNIESLIEDQEVSDKNVQYASILDISGVPHKTTIYNLEVLNKLGMCCFRGNKKAKEIRNKFNDVLIKDETKTPAMSKAETQTLTMPMSYADALRALADEVEAKEAAQKALEAEKEQHEKDNADFCEGLAILESKKAEIGSRREAKAMSKAAVAVKQCKKLTDENESLKNAIGRGKNWITINAIKNNWIKVFGHAPSWAMLKTFSQQVGIMPVKDVLETITDRSGGKHEKYVNRYHIKAWTLYRDWEVSLLKSKVENI